jgi:type IV secretory pathway TraG/TraD family ATPase VirD4
MLLSGCLIRFDNLGQIYEAMSDMELVGERLSEVEDDASRLANSFLASLASDGKIASNVVATLATSLSGWADSTARESTSASDFDAEMIVQQPTAVVLACPGRQRAIYAPYLGAVLRKLMLDLDTIGERNHGPLPLPVGVILDEFPTLGKLDSLVADVNLVRKRRISIMLAAQTKGQFHMIYGPPGTDALFAGMATQIVFGGTDQETADFYAKASGQATELTEDPSAGFKLGRPDQEIPNTPNKPQKRQRQLLTSDEIQTPTRGNATIFTRYVTASYATQLILWAKLTRAYERDDWLQKLKGLTTEDAFVIQRPIEFGKKVKEAQASPAK